MSKEAEKFYQDYYGVSDDCDIQDHLVKFAEAYHQHRVKEWTDERINERLLESGVDTNNMIGSSYKLGILYLRDKLKKGL